MYGARKLGDGAKAAKVMMRSEGMCLQRTQKVVTRRITTMKTLKTMIASSILVAVAAMAPSALAVPITLGTAPGRVATLDSATQGTTGLGNATEATLNGISFGGISDWDEKDESTSSTNGGLFTVNTTGGTAWGNSASGTWTINDLNFWTTFGSVAISMHVGNGGGDPDHFIWLIEQGELSGTWSYTRGNTGGGGLSNLKLYAAGTGSRVPDAGTSVVLLGAGLLGIGALRRRLAK